MSKYKKSRDGKKYLYTYRGTFVYHYTKGQAIYALARRLRVTTINSNEVKLVEKDSNDQLTFDV